MVVDTRLLFKFRSETMMKLPSIHQLSVGTIKEVIYMIIGDHLVTMETQMLQVVGEKCLKNRCFRLVFYFMCFGSF